MKKLLIAALLAVYLPAMAANTITLPIRGITDGDTIKSSISLPCPLCNISVRIDGIDTPERSPHAKCSAEAKKAAEAKQFIIELVGNTKTMEVKNFKWDKYGGRVLGQVYIDDVNVGEQLIKNGFAREYHGEAKKSWCNS